jgi:hypothetical protein
MKINEIIIIVVSVLVFALIPISQSSRIGTGVKKIIAVLYIIFALVSMILSILENIRLKKSFNEETATFKEREAYNKDSMKSGGLAFLGGFLMAVGGYFLAAFFKLARFSVIR